ncbi:MAG: preprotein translocase subunit YajC [Planctomycetota bacterium]
MIEIPAIQIATWSTALVQDGAGVLGAPAAGSAGAGSTDGSGATNSQSPPPGGLGWFMPMLAVMMVFLIMSTMMSGRKEKKRRAEMMASIGKRDRVQTVGGMIGNIVEIKGDEYLLETDRGTNSRAWIAKTAVSAVIRSASKAGDYPTESTEETGETANA